jgi:hypothetical protein
MDPAIETSPRMKIAANILVSTKSRFSHKEIVSRIGSSTWHAPPPRRRKSLANGLGVEV